MRNENEEEEVKKWKSDRFVKWRRRSAFTWIEWTIHGIRLDPEQNSNTNFQSFEKTNVNKLWFDLDIVV